MNRPAPVTFGPFLFDEAQARLLREGRPVALSGRPLQVLSLLLAHPGQLLDKNAVLDAVWGHRNVSESVLKGAVNVLRLALGDDAKAPRYVETVPRRGYRFVGTVMAASAAAPTAAAATSAAAATPGNLPPTAGTLVGRAAEAAALAAALCRQRLVTLTGLGGVGKTRLALAVAAQAPPPDGAWLLRLEELADPALLLPTLAQTLGLGPGASASPAALVRALQAMRLRLVLDNAEHLVEAVAALTATLLAEVPGLQLLVTSQMPLRLAEEQVLPLAPLALPADLADAAPPPQHYAAAQLFCQRVAQLRPGYEPSPAEHADIAAICRALDGVPLALELAAARVPLLSVAGVRQRLDQRFALLTSGPRDAAARHRTLAAALDWTFGLLGPAERSALQRLAVFSGGFGIDAAEAVLEPAAAPLDLVDALRERSLLVAETGPQGVRLRLYDSVRRHALQHLAAAGDEANARQRHLAWMRRRFEQADLDEFVTPLQTWLPPLRAEIDSLRAALRFGLDAAAPQQVQDSALRLLAASVMFWFRSGNRREGSSWLQAAEALPCPAATAPYLDHARGQFNANAQMGEPALALQALHRSRPVWQAAGDVRRHYLSLYAEFTILLRTDPAGDRSALLAQMAGLLQPDWTALQRRHLLLVQGIAARSRGDIEGYRAASQQLAAGCRAAGAWAECWSGVNGQAQALALLSRRDEACSLLAAAVDEIRAAGQLREHAALVAMAATLHLWRDGTPPTHALAREALRLLQADGMVWWMADALAWAAWHDGRPADAARLQAWADTLVRSRGEARGPLFRGLHTELQQALAAHPAGAQAVNAAPALDEPSAIDLALGPGAAAGLTQPLR